MKIFQQLKRTVAINTWFVHFCRSASRTLVRFEVTTKLVRYKQARSYCDNYLRLMDDGVQTDKFYCSEVSQNYQIWNKDFNPVSTTSTLGVKYWVKRAQSGREILASGER